MWLKMPGGYRQPYLWEGQGRYNGSFIKNVVLMSILVSLWGVSLLFVRSFNQMQDALRHAEAQYPKIGEVHHTPINKPVYMGEDRYQAVRAVTSTGVFWILFENDAKEGQLSVAGLKRVSPDPEWISEEMPITPEVAVALADYQDIVGVPVRMKSRHIVETTKGVYQLSYQANQVSSVVKEGEEVVSIPLVLPVQGRTNRFLKKQEERTGELLTLVSVNWTEDKQEFVFYGEKGIFRLDEYHDGSVELLVGEVSYRN